MNVARLVAVPAVLLVSIAGAAGCGGDDAESTAAPAPKDGGGSLALRAVPGQLRYDKAQLSAPAGKVTIVMANASSVPHDVDLEGNGVSADGAVVGEGKTSTVSADLKPGTYTFFCSVSGHRQAGMQGTLTVR
jgi:plastocyanin